MVTVLVPSPAVETEGSCDADAHVQRLLNSSQLLRADTQRRLLAYQYQHRHETLSEYALTTEALGRSDTLFKAHPAPAGLRA